MNVYLAPMEGVTTAEYREALRRHYPGVDRFFTPFLVANHTHSFKRREKRELLPYRDDLVPQILTNSAEDFQWAARELAALGYAEVNLNLGCPSATVVTKGKGAGMLADPEKLDRFFDEVFRGQDLPRISVKTRVGIRPNAGKGRRPSEAPAEREAAEIISGSAAASAARIAAVYAKYPFAEIMIHPRMREDFYQGQPDLAAFRAMKEPLACPVCYNGDLRRPADVRTVAEQFPDLSAVMIGRGIVAAPWLAEDFRSAAAGAAPDLHAAPAERRTDTASEQPAPDAEEKRRIPGHAAGFPAAEGDRLKGFLQDLWETYRAGLSGDRDVLHRMKELWFYLGQSFPGRERALYDIRKARSKAEYDAAVSALLDDAGSRY